MTPEQFVLWMQGFVEGSNAYNLTPAGWDTVKAKLKEVQEGKGLVDIFRPNSTEIIPPYNPQPYFYGPSPSLPDDIFRVGNISGVKFGGAGESSNKTYSGDSTLPPFEKVDISSDSPFQPERGIVDRTLNTKEPPHDLSLKLETVQVQHKLREICKDVTLEQEEESGLPYWQYRENLGVNKGPFIPQHT